MDTALFPKIIYNKKIITQTYRAIYDFTAKISIDFFYKIYYNYYSK